VQGFGISLGSFDVEEDAARTYDAAVVRYEVSGRTLNFPGEAPRAEVLDALPPPPEPIVAPLEVARERRPPRALPRGTTYPDGAMAPTAADPAVGVAGDEPKMKKKSASKKRKKKTAEPAKDGSKPKMKKQSGYMYHNAQNRELAKAMVASDPATAQLGAQEKINAVRKKLAAMWGALDDAAKRAYADIAPMVAVKPRKAKKSKVVEVPAAAVGVRAKGLARWRAVKSVRGRRMQPRVPPYKKLCRRRGLARNLGSARKGVPTPRAPSRRHRPRG
jgi:hypothetical protein